MEQHAFEVKGHMAIGKKASGPIKVDQSLLRIANLPVGKCTAVHSDAGGLAALDVSSKSVDELLILFELVEHECSVWFFNVSR